MLGENDPTFPGKTLGWVKYAKVAEDVSFFLDFSGSKLMDKDLGGYPNV